MSDGGGTTGLFILSGVSQTQTSTASFENSGGIFGGQLGYNYQVQPSWLIGVEADIQYSSIKGNGTSAINTVLSGAPFFLPPWITEASTKVKWFGTLRARVGYLPAPNVLLYLTGGLAYGDVERTASVANTVPGPGTTINPTFSCVHGTACFALTESHTEIGWTLGGGVEYKFARQWSVKAEYFHVELDGRSLILPATQPPGNAMMNAAFSATKFDLVCAGIKYKFY